MWLAGYTVAKQAIVPIFEDATLEIDSDRFRITSSGLGQDQCIEGFTADLQVHHLLLAAVGPKADLYPSPKAASTTKTLRRRTTACGAGLRD